MYVEEKSRIVPSYPGAIGDLLRYVTTASYAKTPANLALLEDSSHWLSEYYRYQALRYQSAGSMLNLGAERIQWTSSGRDKMNPCLHQRSFQVNVPYLLIRDLGTTYKVWRYYRQNTLNYVPLPLAQILSSDVDFQAARSRAWHNMQPRFEGRVSMLNFLYELKDFRDIVKHVFRYKDTIAMCRNTFTKLRRSERKSLRPLHTGDPTAAIASGILVNNFAIQPLIKDITNIFQQMNIIVSEAQSQFQDNGAELQHSNYSEELERSESWTVNPAIAGWCGQGERKVAKFTATLRYTYDYSMRSNIQAWMKYWGLCGSFQAFWNMIPFSFLADYFVQIGNSIRAMEHDRNVDLNQVGYCESIKTQYQKGWITVSDPKTLMLIIDEKNVSTSSGDRVISGISGSFYQRWPTEPYYGPAALKFKTPSGKQALNMACLLRCLL